MTGKRPGGETAKRDLQFIWIADCSGSMSLEGKIESLNTAIHEAIPHMQSVAKENPHANVLVRALKFSNGATWQIGTPTPVLDFKWVDLTAEGVTDMGKALSMVAEQMKMPPMTERGLPPVLVLVSDGQPTDDFNTGLKDLMDERWGQKAVRMAIAIGTDADQDTLERFVGNPEIPVLQAKNPETLARHIRFISTTVLKAASQPASQSPGGGSSSANVPIPTAGDQSDPSSAADVW